jgi:hypothetical protein
MAADDFSIRKLLVDADGILIVPMGTTLPSSGTVAHMLFLKTDTGVLYRRNAANDAWIKLAEADHGGLAGLGDDDHTQYILVGGTRAFSGNQDMATYKITGLGAPTLGTDAATKEYVDDGKTWKDQIIDIRNAPPAHVEGNRYIVGDTPSGLWIGHTNEIVESISSAWVFEAPAAGWTTFNVGTSKFLVYSGTAWQNWDATTDHGQLVGLGDDDHTQYEKRSEVKSGTVANSSFSGTPKKYAVVFGTVMASANYAVSIVGVDARLWTIESKANTGFTISSNSDVALTGSTDWTAVLHQNP